MSDGFKGTDFCELHHAMGLKIEDDTDVDLEFLQWHLGNIVNRMMLTDEKCDREVELCRVRPGAHRPPQGSQVHQLQRGRDRGVRGGHAGEGAALLHEAHDRTDRNDVVLTTTTRLHAAGGDK